MWCSPEVFLQELVEGYLEGTKMVVVSKFSKSNTWESSRLVFMEYLHRDAVISARFLEKEAINNNRTKIASLS
jgi:hypothetical protein